MAEYGRRSTPYNVFATAPMVKTGNHLYWADATLLGEIHTLVDGRHFQNDAAKGSSGLWLGALYGREDDRKSLTSPNGGKSGDHSGWAEKLRPQSSRNPLLF